MCYVRECGFYFEVDIYIRILNDVISMIYFISLEYRECCKKRIKIFLEMFLGEILIIFVEG